MPPPVILLCWPRRLGARARGRAGGFSLVEVMIAVAIVSFLAMMAVPAVSRLKNKARASATAHDLRVFEAAFQGYASEKGVFPTTSDPGQLPPEMVDRIQAEAWAKISPVGGHYAWAHNQVFNGVPCAAAITITPTPDSALVNDADQLEALDRMIDDGNLGTGSLIFGGDGSLVWIVER